MDLDELLSKADEYDQMKAGNFELSKVYGFGETIAQKVGMSPALDLHGLIRCNGGTVHYVDHAKFRIFEKRNIFKNSIYVHDERNFDVILPSYAPLVENRYTMAHELGHYILHSKNGKCYASRNGEDLVEQEADCFALGFLMPESVFRESYDKCEGNIYELSIAFLVPTEIVDSRIRSLRLKK